MNHSSPVHAKLNYSKNLDSTLTELFFYESPMAKDIHGPGGDPCEVAIHSGWSTVKDFSIDKEGFALHPFTTGFDNWEEEQDVRANFYTEVVDFLKKTVRAKSVLAFDHTIRTKAKEAKKLTQETNTSQRAPVMLVHCDYTSESGPV